MSTPQGAEAKRPQAEAITIHKRSRKRRIVEWFFGLTSLAYFLFYWENNVIQTRQFERIDARVPRELDGLTIVQISDLHHKEFGANNKRLLAKIRQAKPDIIAITGDLIDERNFDLNFTRRFIAACVDIAPTLYVTGNHEMNFHDHYLFEFLDAVEASGAYLMDDRAFEISRQGQALQFSPKATLPQPRRDDDSRPSIPPQASVTTDTTESEEELLDLLMQPEEPSQTETESANPNAILIAGVADPVRYRPQDTQQLDVALSCLPRSDQQFAVLLSHRPEAFDVYVKRRFDLTLTGHAHGGQCRIPGILPNGLIAPNQGWFPRYASGIFEKDSCAMIVSRGLGASVVPTRIMNRPELVVCRIRRAND